MFKIKGYLKKFWYLILVCICLLFVQAQTELTLPDYMSDIVSVGIQAGGFASPATVIKSVTLNLKKVSHAELRFPLRSYALLIQITALSLH